jgi:hypothetical protein
VDPFDELNAALDAYDGRQRELRTAAETKRSEREAFLAEFVSFRDAIAIPVLEEIGIRLRERGHEFNIEIIEPNGQSRDAGISFNVRLTTEKRQSASSGDTNPRFTVRANPVTCSIDFDAVTPLRAGGAGQGGPALQCKLSALSAYCLRSKAISAIAASLNRAL